jgi:formylmethanofuran dehydrogenase subunit E
MNKQVDEKTRLAVEALMRKQVKKKRRCLKCGELFMSNNSGHRFCCWCKDEDIEKGVLAEGMAI